MDAPLLIVDLPWLLYRSHFALPSSVRDEQGRRTGALRGSIDTLLALTGPGGPLAVRAVAICTGAEDGAYRRQAFPGYHAHRDPMPAELREQFDRAPRLLAAFGWVLYDGGDLEADDVINSLALAESAAHGTGLVVSADRDLYATVGPNTAVLELRRGAPPGLIDVAGVLERAGVRPDQIPDLIALRGDPSDGIPGAKGIGAKGAASLLSRFETLEQVLDAAADGAVPGRAGSSLVTQRDELLMFKRIATLQRPPVEPPDDAPLDLDAGARALEADGLEKLAQRVRALSARA